ncbi:MAG: glycosyltransferase [Bacteroidota bacterium]
MPPSAPASLGSPLASDAPATPRISIVVPTLNEEKTLAAVLEPLRAHADSLGLELIVSDGGSDDGTLAIALSLADRVVTHEGPERQTIAEGRNAGAREAACASGDVLLFFNADVDLPDEIEPFLSDLRGAAIARGAATCRVEVDPQEARISERIVLGTANRLYWAINRLRIVGMGRGEVHAVRRDVFEAVGGYREHLAAGEDFDLFKRILRQPGASVDFLWRHVVYESPRRYRQRGLLRTMSAWALNAAWVAFRDRSRSTEWEAVR